MVGHYGNWSQGYSQVEIDVDYVSRFSFIALKERKIQILIAKTNIVEKWNKTCKKKKLEFMLHKNKKLEFMGIHTRL